MFDSFQLTEECHAKEEGIAPSRQECVIAIPPHRSSLKTTGGATVVWEKYPSTQWEMLQRQTRYAPALKLGADKRA